MAAVLAGATKQEVNLMLLLFGLLTAPLLWNLWAAGSLVRGLSATRTLPEAAVAGQPTAVRLALHNARHSAVLAVAVVDRIQFATRRSQRGEPSVWFPRVLSKDSAQGSYESWFGLRGLYRFGPLQIVTRYPFGLVEFRVELPELAELLVSPRPGRLTPRWPPVTQSRLAGAANGRGLPARGATGELYGLRPWQAGDSARWIHWRTSARRGSWMVRQGEPERARDLVLLAELWRPTPDSAEARASCELLLRFLATVIRDQGYQGSRRLWCGIAGAGPQRLLSGPASRGLVQDIYRLLAQAEASSQPAWVELCRDCAAHRPRDAQVILVTSRAVPENVLENAGLNRGAADQPAGLPTVWKRAPFLHVGRGDLDPYFIDERLVEPPCDPPPA